MTSLRLSWMTAVLLIVVVLAGCAAGTGTNNTGNTGNSSGTSGNAGTDNASSEPVEQIQLRFVTSEEQGSAMYGAIQELIATYNAENENVQVQLENIPYDTFTEKLTAQLIGGRAPDAALLLDRWATAMMAQNALLPVSDYVPAGYAEEFNVNSWEYARGADGKAYAIPLYANVQALLYNKDLLEQAGVEVPTEPGDAWDFDQLVEVARQVKANTDVDYGFAHWPNSTPSRISQYLVAAGGSVLTPDFTDVALDGPEGLEMFEKIQATFEEGLVPADNWTTTGNPHPMQIKFVNQEIAMFLASGNFQTVYLNDNIGDKFRWGFTYMPTTLGTPIELVAFQQTRHPEEVMTFLQYMASPENMAKLAVQANAVPTRTNLAGGALQYQVAPEEMTFLMKQLELASPQIQGEMKQPYWSEIDLMIRKKLELMSLGQLTPEQAVKESADEARAIIAKYQ